MSEMNPKVDWFFTKKTSWQQEYSYLRNLVLETGLAEELKWGVPCYTLNGNNVVLIHGFKNYCALLFHKGVLLQDPQKLLIQQTPNVQAARQLRFSGLLEIVDREPAIKSYLSDAILVEKSGKKVPLKKTEEFQMPAEFAEKMAQMPGLKDAFELLTPGRQRAYLLHFSSAKLAKTREARVVENIPRILDGKGLED